MMPDPVTCLTHDDQGVFELRCSKLHLRQETLKHGTDLGSNRLGWAEDHDLYLRLPLHEDSPEVEIQGEDRRSLLDSDLDELRIGCTEEIQAQHGLDLVACPLNPPDGRCRDVLVGEERRDQATPNSNQSVDPSSWEA